EVDAERLHHAGVRGADAEGVVVAALARQRGDLRGGGGAGDHRVPCVLDDLHAGEMGRAAVRALDRHHLGLDQLVGDVDRLRGVALVVEYHKLDFVSTQLYHSGGDV